MHMHFLLYLRKRMTYTTWKPNADVPIHLYYVKSYCEKQITSNNFFDSINLLDWIYVSANICLWCCFSLKKATISYNFFTEKRFSRNDDKSNIIFAFESFDKFMITTLYIEHCLFNVFVLMFSLNCHRNRFLQTQKVRVCVDFILATTD